MNPRSRTRLLVAAVLGISAVAGLAVGFVGATAGHDPAPGAGTDYPKALLAAADDLAARTAPGGSGYTFEVLHNQVAYPNEPGGSFYLQPDPSASPVAVDHAYLMGMMTRGAVRPEGFFMEVRGALEDGDAPDWDKVFPQYSVIDRADGLWRQDETDGYTQTDVSPGLGIDPFTASRFPALLRNLMAVKDEGPTTIGGETFAHYTGKADAVYWPGIIASDGLTFTDSPISVDVLLDSEGRLVRLTGLARNLNQLDSQLMVDAMISLGYDDVPPIPEPSPGLAPRPRETDVPEASPSVSPSASPAVQASDAP